jgi:RNA polymerase sigma-70 factor (ECF subfamily)
LDIVDEWKWSYDAGQMASRDRDRNAALMRDALAHADALYNFARYLSRDPVAAEDLVQEAFARALAAVDQFADGSNLKSWLFRILRNTFIDLYRRDQRAQTDSGLDTIGNRGAAASDDGATPRQEREVMGRELEQAILSLTDDARVAVLLDLEGFSEAEMAEALGCAVGTVKSRLFRARAALRERLGGHGNE